jgi:hypothetical protein
MEVCKAKWGRVVIGVVASSVSQTRRWSLSPSSVAPTIDMSSLLVGASFSPSKRKSVGTCQTFPRAMERASGSSSSSSKMVDQTTELSTACTRCDLAMSRWDGNKSVVLMFLHV